MKIIISIVTVLTVLNGFTQIKSPRASSSATVIQKVGLTELSVKYSRPNKNDRVIFGELVPFDEVWRTGANENTVFTTEDYLLLGADTLPAGKYSIYTKPGKDQWVIYFYATTDNWGNPQTWEEDKVVLSLSSKVEVTTSVIESFTISFEHVTSKQAHLVMSWDKTRVSVLMKVPTDEKMMASINKTMSGVSSGDYYAAADYYLSEKKDMKQALIWIDKAIDAREGQPFWMMRKKSLIQAELKDYKGAIETAKISLEGAKEAGYSNYVSMNEVSIKEWSSKK